MHSSARSELKTGLAESRIETKLPIKEGRLLHVCLTEVKRFTCGWDEMPVMQEGPLFAAGVKPANQKEYRRDRRLSWNQNGRRKVVVVIRETRRQFGPGRIQY